MKYAYFSQIANEAKNVFLQEYDNFKQHVISIASATVPVASPTASSQVATLPQFQFNPAHFPVGFLLVGFDSNESNQFKIYSYDSPNFDPTERSDNCVLAAQWQLSQVISDYLQYPQMAVDQLKELAVILMLHTSSFNDTVWFSCYYYS